MKVKVTLPRNITDEIGRAKTVRMSDGSSILDLVRKLEVRPDGIIALVGDSPVPLDRVLHDGEHVELLSIVSGG